MPKAVSRITTLTMLDAIAPQRQRFNVINNPAPVAPKTGTMRAINRAVAKLPPMHTDIPAEAPLPGVTCYGKITDQPAYTAAYMARLAAKKGGDL